MREMGGWGGRARRGKGYGSVSSPTRLKGKGINLIFPLYPLPLSLSPCPVCPMPNAQ